MRPVFHSRAETLGAFRFFFYLYFRNGLTVVNCVQNKLWVQKLANKVSGFDIYMYTKIFHFYSSDWIHDLYNLVHIIIFILTMQICTS